MGGGRAGIGLAVLALPLLVWVTGAAAVPSGASLPSVVPEAASGFRSPLREDPPLRRGGFGFELVQHPSCPGSPIVHPGVDLNGPGGSAADDDDPVLAVANGLVVYTAPDANADGRPDNWGGVVIQHLYKGETYYSQYGHVDQIYVRRGAQVTKGQIVAQIGRVALTPVSPHLHLEIRAAQHPDPQRGNFWSCRDFANAERMKLWYRDPLVFLSEHGPYASSIYAESGGGPSQLYRVSPSRTGRDTAIGTIRLASGGTPEITDIARGKDAKGRERLYAVSWNHLYVVNTTNGVAQEVSAAVLRSGANINALVSLRNGTLLAAGTGGTVVTIDTSTGRGTVIGSFGESLRSSGDLVVGPGGQMYATAMAGPSDVLVQVNPGTGRAKSIGPIGFSRVYGLAMAQGRLLGLTSSTPGCRAGGLVGINVSTGKGTLVRCISFSAWGGT